MLFQTTPAHHITKETHVPQTNPVAAIHLRLLFGRMAACMVFPCHHCQPPAARTSANRTRNPKTPRSMDDDRYCLDRRIHSFPSHTRPDLLVLYLSFYTIHPHRCTHIRLGKSRSAKPSRYIRQHRPIPYRDFPTVRRAQTLVLDTQKTLTA